MKLRYLIIDFRIDRGVFFINGYVVSTIRYNIRLYAEAEVNIRTRPTGKDYSPWAEAIYDARGQIGLLAEEASVKSGVDWDKDCEGTVITKNDS